MCNSKLCINKGCSNKRAASSNTKLRPYCATCHKKEYSGEDYKGRIKKDYCEACGDDKFDRCQLQLDHKDGNSDNNTIDNIWTLCSNCHVLKSKLCEDNKKNSKQHDLISFNRLAEEVLMRRPKLKKVIDTIRKKVFKRKKTNLSNNPFNILFE